MRFSVACIFAISLPLMSYICDDAEGVRSSAKFGLVFMLAVKNPQPMPVSITKTTRRKPPRIRQKVPPLFFDERDLLLFAVFAGCFAMKNLLCPMRARYLRFQTSDIKIHNKDSKPYSLFCQIAQNKNGVGFSISHAVFVSLSEYIYQTLLQRLAIFADYASVT